MLQTITQLDKFTALHRMLLQKGMLIGSTSAYISQQLSKGGCASEHEDGEEGVSDVEEEDDEVVDMYSPPSQQLKLTKVQSASIWNSWTL